MNISQIKDYVIENNKYIEILEELGCTNITYHKNHSEIRCSIKHDSNPTALKINLETTFFTYYGDEKLKNRFGDIFILVQTLENINFPESINYIKKILGLTDKTTIQQKRFPFGGFYHAIKKKNSLQQDIEIQTYPEEILNQFRRNANLQFLKDGISIETQLKFNIGYDEYSNRISIPWRNQEGKIAGVMGRYNDTSEYCKDNGIPKWYPIIPFEKSKVLYGFSENYNTLLNNTIYVGESEKFTLQLSSMGIFNGCSVGSHSLSPTQALLIKSLYPNEVIFCYDEDISDEEYLINECKKVKSANKFMNIKTGYIFDKEHKYLKEGSKSSPTDNGIETFCKLLEECLFWVE